MNGRAELSYEAGRFELERANGDGNAVSRLAIDRRCNRLNAWLPDLGSNQGPAD